MKGYSGLVGPDGNSILPEGLYDMAEAGEDIALDEALEKKISSLLDSDEVQAAYKLEIAFTEKRSIHNPFAGFVSAWSNGGFMHGGGDEAIYFCPNKVPGKDGVDVTCGEPITLHFVSGKVAICQKCRNAVKPGELVGQVFARLPMQQWAGLITRLFHSLGCNADIRIGVMRGDLRQANTEERGDGEVLTRVRTSREWVIYPLKNIIKDTSAGSDLFSRIRAFLAA